MRVMGWLLMAVGLALAVWRLNYDTILLMGSDATLDLLRDPGVENAKATLVMASGFIFVAGSVMAAGGAIVQAIKGRAET